MWWYSPADGSSGPQGVVQPAEKKNTPIMARASAFVVECILGGPEDCYSSGNLQGQISEMCSLNFHNNTWLVVRHVEMVSLYEVNDKAINSANKKFFSLQRMRNCCIPLNSFGHNGAKTRLGNWQERRQKIFSPVFSVRKCFICYLKWNLSSFGSVLFLYE